MESSYGKALSMNYKAQDFKSQENPKEIPYLLSSDIISGLNTHNKIVGSACLNIWLNRTFKFNCKLWRDFRERLLINLNNEFNTFGCWMIYDFDKLTGRTNATKKADAWNKTAFDLGYTEVQD